jgi:hypothetical protein
MQPTDPQNESRAQATVKKYGKDRSILTDHLQYKRQHMPVSNTTHLANCHKQRMRRVASRRASKPLKEKKKNTDSVNIVGMV